MTKLKIFAGGLMLSAACSMAVPAAAAPIGSGISSIYDLQELRQNSLLDLDEIQWDQGDEIAERRRWRRRGRFRRGRRGVRGGDILAGVLVLGGIAAIASAASNNNRRRDREVVVREVPRSDPRVFDTRSSANELSQAADQCSFAVEGQAGNDARIDRITTVARDGNGWRVEGLVSFPQGQDQFLCGVTAGQIDYIQIGAGADEF